MLRLLLVAVLAVLFGLPALTFLLPYIVGLAILCAVFIIPVLIVLFIGGSTVLVLFHAIPYLALFVILGGIISEFFK